jgi:hypothetical protein
VRRFMGIWRHPHGTYYARKKVPERLVQEVGRSWLKQSLRTKDIRLANVLVKPVLAEFDRILAKAEPSTEPSAPPIATLDAKLIKSIADHHYASTLAEDERIRHSGTGSQPLFNSLLKQLQDAGEEFQTPFTNEAPEFGLSDREWEHEKDAVAVVLPAARSALARGDITFIGEELDELLAVFRLNVTKGSAAYRELGYEVLKAHVRGLEALGERHRGRVVDTPKVLTAASDDAEMLTNKGVHSADPPTLRDAFDGWQKAKTRPISTVKEFEYAVRLFEELHGSLPVTTIARSHVRQFREALQMIPTKRTGAPQKAPLPDLVEWSKAHPDAPRIKVKTINKLLAGTAALAVWSHDNGLIPEDAPWTNPFAKMLLEDEEPTREPWDIAELRTLFASPVYTREHRPKGGSGEAAFWLPLLGIFTGAPLPGC